MRLGYHRRRVGAFAAGMRLVRELDGPALRDAGALRERRRARLDALVRHAREHSPFYRERLPAGPVALERLPVLEKPEMMARFDELVCDRRLRRDETLAWIERLEDDELLLGEYRAMTTSGSSGQKGLFVYDREGWASIVAQFLRASMWFGVRPRLPRRTRMAMVRGSSPSHMSVQGTCCLRVGVHRVLSLSTTEPIERQVAALNAFRPDFLNAYPSAAMRLAEEQEAGRLRLGLAGLSTSSEMRTPAMAERLEAAFGVRPHEAYATTEGLFGATCEHHDGLHLFEDVSLVENVDADGRPVPPGEPGARLLVTQLHNRVQPLIRLAVPDVVTLDPEPCACGRPLVRARAIDGRRDDVLRLPGRAEAVTVLPAHFAAVTRDRDVREFQVRQEGDGLRVLVVPRAGAGPALEDRLAATVRQTLGELGARAAVAVERREALERRGGKLQIVVGPGGKLSPR